MKHIREHGSLREAVHDIIERRILPMVERDGIANLLLPEQITAEQCANIPKRKRPYIGHPAPEMAIGLAGEAIYWIADKAFIFKPGSIVILPGRTIHTAIQTEWRRNANLDPNQPPSVLWLTFFPFGVRVQVSRSVAEKDTTESSSPYVLLGQEFYILVKWLIEEAGNRPPYSSGIGRNILSEMMQRLLRAAVTEATIVDSTFLMPEQILSITGRRRVGKGKKRPRKSAKGASKRLPQVVRDAEDFINSNYGVPLSLDEIADAADTSPDHLGRAFKAATGMTPIQYLIDIRMRAARELLMTDLKAFEVGQMVGIKNACRFSRMFRQHTGLTPLQYRREMAKLAKSI